MPVFSLDDALPELPGDGEYWVARNATLIGQVRLGRDASVWFGAVLRADDAVIAIGARSNVQDNSVLHVDPGYPISIGENCTIGHNAVVHGCTIGDGTLIGMGSVVLNGARIGRNCLVGANTLITENKVIPDNSVVMGAPGKVVREIDAAGLQLLAEGAELYVKRWHRYRDNLRQT
ncbi:MAG: gamma carbonic anhydrase family protein [Acidisphaera sp.]|nr:gamma carbonic anhydrase family protein [Acidisphaera sp.]